MSPRILRPRPPPQPAPPPRGDLSPGTSTRSRSLLPCPGRPCSSYREPRAGPLALPNPPTGHHSPTPRGFQTENSVVKKGKDLIREAALKARQPSRPYTEEEWAAELAKIPAWKTS